MVRLITSAVLVVCCVASVRTAYAWNRAGHMTCAALVYLELQQSNPDQLAKWITLLKSHPHYESRWRRQTETRSNRTEQELYLWMLAARWPDDIRNDAEFHRGSWHYINYPLKPSGQPSSVRTRPPASENIVQAFEDNLAILRGRSDAGKRAVALCWVLHLVGDVHQPLHTTALFTTQFRDGDRGGTRFHIRPDADKNATISLHKFWDDLILGSQNFQSVRNRATEFRQTHARRHFPQLSETRFEIWARQESFSLAREFVYRDGRLRGSTNRSRGILLPADYAAQTQPVAEKQLTLAGYRLADLLKQ